MIDVVKKSRNRRCAVPRKDVQMMRPVVYNLVSGKFEVVYEVMSAREIA